MKKTSYCGSFTPHYKLCAIMLGMSIFSSTFAQNKIDLGSISKNGNGIKYVAIGSSLSAGVRDGGVYAAAQQTSFPALLAQQMGIKDFKQPLLEGNGTGKKTVSVDKNGVLKFSESKDFDDTKKDSKLLKITTDVDNLAVPYQKVIGLGLSETETAGWPLNYSKKAYKHLDRLIGNSDEKTTNYHNLVDKKIKQADFFTYEIGMQDFVELFDNGAYLQEVSFLTYDREGFFPEDLLLKILLSKGAKGAIANLPEISQLPYYTKYSFEKIKYKTGDKIYIQRYTKNDVRLAVDGDMFLPNTIGTNGLLDGTLERGTDFTNPILDEEVIGIEERWTVQIYNSWLERLAKDNNLPIVDLFGLYKKVLAGEYITNDGIIAGAYIIPTAFSSTQKTRIATSNGYTFYFILNVPTGWYQLNIKNGVSSGGTFGTYGTASIKFGIGEVFVIAGQSNAQGYGQNVYNIQGLQNYDCVESLKNIQATSPEGGGTAYVTDIINLERPVFGTLNNNDRNIGPMSTRPWFYQGLGEKISLMHLATITTTSSNYASNPPVPVMFYNVSLAATSINNWEGAMEKTKGMFSANYSNALNTANGITLPNHTQMVFLGVVPWIIQNYILISKMF
jgi:hypothetical protein